MIPRKSIGFVSCSAGSAPTRRRSSSNTPAYHCETSAVVVSVSGRPVLPIVEAAGDDGVHEAVFGGDDVPGEIERALGHGVGPVVALLDRDRVENPARDRMLRGKISERDVAGE